MTERPITPLRRIQVVRGVLRYGQYCFAAKRAPHKFLPHVWEFPGGKVELGETPEAALVREMREELGVEVEVLRWLASASSCNIEEHVELNVYEVRLLGGAPTLLEHAASGWFDSATMLELLTWAGADRAALPQVLQNLNA